MTQEELNTKLTKELQDLTRDFRKLADIYYRTHFIDKDVFQNKVYFNNKVYFKHIIDAMAYASTITLDITRDDFHKTTTINATGNATINASGAGLAGQEMTILIVNDATSGKVITFGTNFKSSGTLTGTTSKSAVINFKSDGLNWYEQYRTLAIT